MAGLFKSGPLRGRGYFGCETSVNLAIWSLVIALIVASAGLLGEGIHYRDTVDCYTNRTWCLNNATDAVCNTVVTCTTVAANGTCTKSTTTYCDASPSRTNTLNKFISAGIAMIVLVVPAFALFFIAKPPVNYDDLEGEEKYAHLAATAPIKSHTLSSDPVSTGRA